MNPNDYRVPFLKQSDLTIDLNMLALSLKAIRDNVTAAEFKDFLEILCEANLKEKFFEFLNQAKLIHSEGTDLATAFSHAQFDILLESGENFIIN
jgi:hypothetical protein